MNSTETNRTISIAAGSAIVMGALIMYGSKNGQAFKKIGLPMVLVGMAVLISLRVNLEPLEHDEFDEEPNSTEEDDD